MLYKKFKIAAVIVFLLGTVYTNTGCKKSKDTQTAVENNTDGGKYYFTGDIDGTPWKADVVAAGDTVHLMLAIGVQIQNRDTSIMVLGFPDNITLNQPTDFYYPSSGSGQGSIAAFEGNSTDVSSAYTSATTSGGKFTVTQLDKSAKMVAGTFNVTLANTSGDEITITNGKFKMPYVESKSPQGLPGNIKF